jgi:hypothetical protein
MCWRSGFLADILRPSFSIELSAETTISGDCWRKDSVRGVKSDVGAMVTNDRVFPGAALRAYIPNDRRIERII